MFLNDKHFIINVLCLASYILLLSSKAQIAFKTNKSIQLIHT